MCDEAPSHILAGMPRDESLVFGDDGVGSRRGPTYARVWSATRRQLQSALLAQYGVTESSHVGLTFPSGMSAITTVLSAVCKLLERPRGMLPNQRDKARGHHGAGREPTAEPFTLVHGSELYCDTFRSLRFVRDALCAEGLVALEPVETHDSAALVAAFEAAARARRPVKLFFVEACANPSARMIDPAVLPRLRQLAAPNAVFVCDNTWLSGALFDPLAHGFDVVADSMTKYGSAGRCIGGAVVAPAGPVGDAIMTWLVNSGIFVAEDHCRIFLDALATLPERMLRHSRRSTRLATFLASDPRCGGVVDRVIHTSRADHPSAPLLRQYVASDAELEVALASGAVRAAPPGAVAEGSSRSGEVPAGVGVMLAHVLAPAKAVEAAMRSLKPHSALELRTSYGGPGSRIDPWTALDRPANHFEGADAGKGSAVPTASGTWIRFSVGFDDDPAAVEHALLKFLGACCGKTLSDTMPPDAIRAAPKPGPKSKAATASRKSKSRLQ